MLGSFEVFPNHSVSCIDLDTVLNSSSSGCGAKASCGLASNVEDSAAAIKRVRVGHFWLLYITVLIMGNASQLLL